MDTSRYARFYCPDHKMTGDRTRTSSQKRNGLGYDFCHAGAGRRAAFGPKIVGQGLSTAIIRTTIENGRGQMPAS